MKSTVKTAAKLTQKIKPTNR